MGEGKGKRRQCPIIFPKSCIGNNLKKEETVIFFPAEASQRIINKSEEIIFPEGMEKISENSFIRKL